MSSIYIYRYQKTSTLHDIEKRYVKSQDDGSIRFRDLRDLDIEVSLMFVR